MGVLDLLAAALQYLVAWVPRPLLVPQTKAVVRWTLGRDPVLVESWGVQVPLIHTIERIDKRVDATEFEPKNLWTLDGAVVAVGMVIVWHVGDPIRCCRTVNGLNELVSRLGESVLPEFVGTFPLADFKGRCAGGKGREWGANALLRTRLSARFDEYGIAIDDAFVNFTDDKVSTIKLIGSGNQGSAVSVMVPGIE
jgi:regulator of protease activity HflC (stomatin/prohibitin superfamily)